VPREAAKRKREKSVVEAIQGKAEVRIGKQGVTPSLVEEIRKRLRAKQVLKVRVNRNALRAGADKRKVAEEVAALVGAEVVDVRGSTFVLARKS